MKKTVILITLIISMLMLSNCQQGSTQIIDMWMRAAPADRPATAAFATIHNKTDREEVLLGASSADCERVELHTMEMTDGVMKMRPVDNIKIPSGQSLELKPGGNHIMLIGLKKEFVAGENHSITLKLANAGEMTLPFPIKDQ